MGIGPRAKQARVLSATSRGKEQKYEITNHTSSFIVLTWAVELGPTGRRRQPAIVGKTATAKMQSKSKQNWVPTRFDVGQVPRVESIPRHRAGSRLILYAPFRTPRKFLSCAVRVLRCRHDPSGMHRSGCVHRAPYSAAKSFISPKACSVRRLCLFRRNNKGRAILKTNLETCMEQWHSGGQSKLSGGGSDKSLQQIDLRHAKVLFAKRGCDRATPTGRRRLRKVGGGYGDQQVVDIDRRPLRLVTPSRRFPLFARRSSSGARVTSRLIPVIPFSWESQPIRETIETVA
jgi:hypothetical protein